MLCGGWRLWPEGRIPRRSRRGPARDRRGQPHRIRPSPVLHSRTGWCSLRSRSYLHAPWFGPGDLGRNLCQDGGDDRRPPISGCTPLRAPRAATRCPGSSVDTVLSPSRTETPTGWRTGTGFGWSVPRHLRLRVLESTVAFANAFRGLGAGLIPEEAAQTADNELRRYHREHPGIGPMSSPSAWHVPVRWFTAFQPDDKEVYEVDGAPRVRLRVDLGVGLKRVDHALEVLRGLQVFQGPAEELAQLADWLDSFPSTIRCSSSTIRRCRSSSTLRSWSSTTRWNWCNSLSRLLPTET